MEKYWSIKRKIGITVCAIFTDYCSFCVLMFDAFTTWLHEGAGMGQWWERSPSTNVSWVRFPGLASYVDWVCWFSTLLREAFLRVLRFSPLLKNQHLIWFDLFGLQSPRLVEHSCSARTIRDLNKVSIIIIMRKNELESMWSHFH